MPEYFPSSKYFPFLFHDHFIAFYLFDDRNCHVIIEVMASGVVNKMLGEFTATDSFLNVVPVIVETDVKGCLALSNIR